MSTPQQELESLRKYVAELEAKLKGLNGAGSQTSQKLPDSAEDLGVKRLLQAADILENFSEALLVLDRDWRIVYMNREAARINRKEPEEFVGRTHWEGWPAFLGTEVERQYRRVMEERIPAHFEHFYEGDYNVWLEIHAYPWQNGIAIYYRDITDQKTVQCELSEREKELETAGVALHWIDEAGTILWANHAELELLGYSREEYVGHNIIDFHVDAPVIVKLLALLKTNQEVRAYEARLRRKDGSIRYVSVHSNVYRQNGRFIYTRCFTRDITDHNNTSELQQRLAAIVESSDDAILSKDLDGIIRSWNRGAQLTFGYTAEEVIGKHISMLAAPEVVDEIPDILNRIKRGERVDHYETKRRTKDGRILNVSLTVSPIRDAFGTVVGASKVARDISEQKRNFEIQERLAAIVESSDDAIVSKDLNGIIRSWNRGAQRIFGYTAEEVLGKHITILAPPDVVDEIPDILARIGRGERIDHYETRRRTKDGRILNVSLTVSPVRDASGTIVGASKVARDISERVRGEQALQEANEALTRANADLEQFAYSASHDLQEPLRMVAIYSEMLQKKFGGELGAKGEEFIRYTLQGARRMEQLLQDLRTYTQVSTRGREPAEDVSANEALRNALKNLEVAIQNSGASITQTDLPRVHAHEVQLGQIFQNLIGNAIRYRSKQPLQVHVAAERQGAEWRFSVRDNGIGIDPEYKEQIFGMFKRLHSTAEFPGTGMGLAICQRVVQRLGGRIWVESEPGRGSTFFFTLPAKPDS